MSSALRQQVIADMKVAGLAPRTQQSYLEAMGRFIRATWIVPEQATEKQVGAYLQALVERGISPGGFKQVRFGLQFLFENTLRRDWGLFKKSAERPSASASPERPPMPIVAG
ncbi:MAG: phage integrase N-terminal SAM-like domain-containing protein [Phycisphaerae bacterium]|nr:phage integrase N-terminal SAM-like domain-containing protein [Phycisphaerae bacterium]